MRVLLSVQPGVGHFQPVLPLAHALVAAGHDLVVATAAAFAPVVNSAGFAAVPAGPDFLQVAAADVFPVLRGLSGVEAAETWMRSVWLDAVPVQKIPDLVRLATTWRPDVVLHDFWDFAAPAAAQVVGVPHAVHLVAPVLPRAAMRTAFGAELAALSRIAGLSSFPDVFRFLCLNAYPPGLQHPSLVVPPTVHGIRPGPFSGERPGWLAELPYPRTIYVGLGTIFGGVDVLRPILTGLQGEGMNVVVALGAAAPDRATLGTQPDHVRLESFLPQAAVLGGAHLCVTHAGPNSMIEALAHAIPMLCVPLSAEQPVNAANCARAGAALVLEPDTLTPQRVRAAVRALDAEPSFRRRARALRDRMMRLPGQERAVALLERLAGTGSPVTAPT